MDWFEEWFDSPLYEQLYAHRDEKEANTLADQIASKFEPDVFPNVLDLACGRGRHSINLARRGYKVLGVDLAPAAIKKATATAGDLGLENVRFQTGDMREPVAETFDMVVNLFTSFGYFDDPADDVQVLKSVKSMLRPGGAFVIDFMNATYTRNNYVPVDQKSFGYIDYVGKKYIRDNTIVKELTFVSTETGEKKQFSERVRLYERPFFESVLPDLGFQIEAVFGEYNGAAFVAATSSRLIIFARLAE